MNRSIDNVNQPGGRSARGTRQDVLDLIHEVMHQLRARQFHTLRDGPHGINRMEARVLGYFARHAGATQSDLALHSGRDKAQLARLVKTLRERGLLHGNPDADDKRNLRLTLTDSGLALQRAVAQQGQQLAVQAVAGLSADERAQLQGLLQRVRDNLDAAGSET